MRQRSDMTVSRARISFAGIAVGSFALLLALVHFWAGPFSPQPSLEKVVADKADAIRDATIAAMKGEKVEAEVATSKMDLDQVLNLAAAVLGGLAIILGVIGFAKREPLRVAGGAAVLGAGAIAFQFAAVALAAIILAILIAAVISQLGIG
jgi:hypothetical protein